MQDMLRDIGEQMRTLFWPDRYFAWQTLLLLSLFSLLTATALETLSAEEEPFQVELLSTLSWIFLVSAIWWALSENPVRVGGFSISPWITGAVLCLFLFEPWSTADRLRWSISSWPLISTTIKALPYFVNWELEAKLPKSHDRSALIMTLLINLLLTSWILFYFRVQDWVSNYPSLLVNDLDRSAFVTDFNADRNQQPQGVPLLESTADAIAEELNGQPWYQTERWLYTRQERLEAISQRTVNSFSAPAEKTFWRIEVPPIKRSGDGYLLKLQAQWLGPVSRDRRFFLEKDCKIVPQDRLRPVPTEADQPPPTSQITAVDCGEEPPVVQWTGDP
ncbi:MAG: DUF5357 family protein [Phormidesmis sp.]